MYIYIKFEIQKSIFLLHHLCPNVFIFLYVLLELFLARLLFTDSDIVMLGKWGFDGLEDWEYPGVRRGSLPGDNKSSPFSVKSCWTPLKLKQQKLVSPAFFWLVLWQLAMPPSIKPLHQMQIWRTTRSAPGTSYMKARLVSLWCFVLTMFPQIILASSSICSVLFRSGKELLCFWMRREGTEIFHLSPLRENSG